VLVVAIVMLVIAGPTLADEWIELHNRSDVAVDLEGWVITRMTSEGERAMLEIEGGIVAARGVFLISNFAPDDPRSRLGVTPGLISSAVSLSNSKLQLRLYDRDPSSGGTVVDVADDGSGAPLAGDPELKRSMVRVDFEGAGTEPAHWDTATESEGWDDGASELGTPGSIPAYLNGAAQQTSTAIEREGWADLKVSLSR
jgi:hypothetical protein